MVQQESCVGCPAAKVCKYKERIEELMDHEQLDGISIAVIVVDCAHKPNVIDVLSGMPRL